MTIDQVRGEVKRLEGFSEIVSESADSYAAWKALVTTHRVSGAQVHDARLAAVMTASGITRILTFNVRDFIRFAGIEAAHPEQIAEVAGPELSYFSACSRVRHHVCWSPHRVQCGVPAHLVVRSSEPNQ